MRALFLVSALCVALMAGLFFAYSFSVVPGLGNLPDEEYLRAMQSINRAIQNPFFFVPFFAPILLLPFSAHQAGHAGMQRLLLTATVVYAAGVMVLTIFGNVPLNNALEAIQIQERPVQELKAQRIAFEEPWNRLNLIRTISAVSAFVLTILACMRQAAVTGK